MQAQPKGDKQENRERERERGGGDKQADRMHKFNQTTAKEVGWWVLLRRKRGWKIKELRRVPAHFSMQVSEKGGEGEGER